MLNLRITERFNFGLRLMLSTSFRTTTTESSAGVWVKKQSKKRADGHTSRPFVDTKRVMVQAGNGGDGCVAFSRLFCNPEAGPSGGNGGNGGHVIVRADAGVCDFSRVPSICRGDDGERGKGDHMHGKSGKHSFIQVPIETEIYEIPDISEPVCGDAIGPSFRRTDTSNLLKVLSLEGDAFTVAQAGGGGRGNAFIASSNQIRAGAGDLPIVRDAHLRLAERGATGEARRILLRLPTFAHIGLVGAPNAGKSTLLRRLTRARPRVAPFAFTTLKAHVGTLNPLEGKEMLDSESTERRTLIIADLPGLVSGAAQFNKGLGAEFLSLIEGCSLLAYLVDLGTLFSPTYLDAGQGCTIDAAPIREQLAMLHHELSTYDARLTDLSLPRLVVGTKIDMLLPPISRQSFHPPITDRPTDSDLLRRLEESLATAAHKTGLFPEYSTENVLLVSARRGDNIPKLVSRFFHLKNRSK